MNKDTKIKPKSEISTKTIYVSCLDVNEYFVSIGGDIVRSCNIKDGDIIYLTRGHIKYKAIEKSKGFFQLKRIIP